VVHNKAREDIDFITVRWGNRISRPVQCQSYTTNRHTLLVAQGAYAQDGTYVRVMLSLGRSSDADADDEMQTIEIVFGNTRFHPRRHGTGSDDMKSRRNNSDERMICSVMLPVVANLAQ
jgi:hypothetical protein